MNVPDEFELRVVAFTETIAIDTDDDDGVAEFGAVAGIPIIVESPILNASPLANKEPTSTLITFDFKEGCDVHQVQGEVGDSVRRSIIRKIRERFKAALREEISRNLVLASLLPENLRIGVHIHRIPREGLHNGQVHIWMVDTILPFYTTLSVMSIVWDSLTDDPILVSLLDTMEYEAMFCGSGYNFY